MGKVKITPLVEERLSELETVLFEEGYFGFKDTAREYVNDIYDFINNIPTLRHYLTKNRKYGSFYCQYKLNRSTSYFLTFDVEEDLFIIRNVITNHAREYPEFIKINSSTTQTVQ